VNGTRVKILTEDGSEDIFRTAAHGGVRKSSKTDRLQVYRHRYRSRVGLCEP